MPPPLAPEGDVGVVTGTEARRKLQRPKMYKVLFHNDHYTTMEFVVWVLVTVFHKSEAEAVEIMLHVHRNGVGVAGIYPYEVAETKAKRVEKLAAEREFPLKVSLEPES